MVSGQSMHEADKGACNGGLPFQTFSDNLVACFAMLAWACCGNERM